MKQTAVEWLMPKILELNLQLSLRRISQRNCELEVLRLFEQAKEMWKEQSKVMFECGRNFQLNGECTFEESYNETFKSE